MFWFSSEAVPSQVLKANHVTHESFLKFYFTVEGWRPDPDTKSQGNLQGFCHILNHSKYTFYSYSQFSYLNPDSDSILRVASWLAHVQMILCDFQTLSGSNAC